MIIFSVESSCDETSCAVIRAEDSRFEILSNVVATQIETHALYGGVVPEIASRAHLEAISAVAERALSDAGITTDSIDAVAVTCAPGLIGALLVGVSFAKSLAYSIGVPLIPVNHIKAHAAAVYAENPDLEYPFYAVIVSGSHTSVYRVTGPTEFVEVGASRDDAAGEAFDKVGRRLGLAYPCGAGMDALAAEGFKNKVTLKLPSPHVKDSTDFSFSGLKTAAVNLIHNERQKLSLGDDDPLPDSLRAEIAAAFTRSVTDGISEVVRSVIAEYGPGAVILAGGVAANSHLRKALSAVAEKNSVPFVTPARDLCGDNAAMIGIQGYFEYLAGVRAGTDLNAYASEEAAEAEGVFESSAVAE